MRRTLATIALTFLLVAPTLPAAAQGPTFGNSPSQPAMGNPGTRLVNPLGSNNCVGGDCLMTFLLAILDVVTRIGFIVVILMTVFVGYKFVAAQGNESKITETKEMLLWTVIGALILLGAKAIALGIQATAQSLVG